MACRIRIRVSNASVKSLWLVISPQISEFCQNCSISVGFLSLKGNRTNHCTADKIWHAIKIMDLCHTLHAIFTVIGDAAKKGGKRPLKITKSGICQIFGPSRVRE